MKLDSNVLQKERKHFLDFLHNHPYKPFVTQMPELAEELSSLDLDHIPALKLVSGLQYQNYLLATVAYEISEFRATLPRKAKYLDIAGRALTHAKHIDMSSVYLLSNVRRHNIMLHALTYQKIKTYLIKLK